MSVELLSPDEALAYWDRRHGRQETLRSGGDIGLSEAENEIFYVTRLGKLVEIIGDESSAAEPLFMLDAGCGKGYFSQSLTRCGHRVHGIDASKQAVEYCQQHHHGSYEVATLDGYRGAWLFDVVYAIDVLFHILDDDLWEASLHNLASLVNLSGLLIVTDESRNDTVTKGDYIVHRARDRYLMAAESWGLSFTDFRPYHFRRNRIGFFVFTRTG